MTHTFIVALALVLTTPGEPPMGLYREARTVRSEQPAAEAVACQLRGRRLAQSYVEAVGGLRSGQDIVIACRVMRPQGRPA